MFLLLNLSVLTVGITSVSSLKKEVNGIKREMCMKQVCGFSMAANPQLCPDITSVYREQQAVLLLLLETFLNSVFVH